MKDDQLSSTCTEVSGTIDQSGHRVHFTLTGKIQKDYVSLIYKIIHMKVKTYYQGCKKELSEKNQTFSFYFTVSHYDKEIEVQCFLNKTSLRLYIYTPVHTLSQSLDQLRIHKQAEETQRIRSLLEEGIIQENIITLHYQPIIEIDSSGAVKAIKGAEAFLRVWDRGEICNPKKYLDVAEKDPLLMRKLGYKILELACSDLKFFKRKYPMFTMSLNVSEQQFARFEDAISFESLFNTVKKQYDVDRHDIALEVPEVSTDRNGENSPMLKRLFDEGTPIILDDFTLGALMNDTEIEIDKFKISAQLLHDGYFGNEAQKFKAQDFLKHIFMAARQNEKSVVVKGVEAHGQIPLLFQLGFSAEFDLVQGNLYCPPMDLQSFEYIYKENVYRLFKSHMLELFKKAEIRVLNQESRMQTEIMEYFGTHKLSNRIQKAHSFSELWGAEDRNLVVIMGYDFVSHIVSQDQLKDQEKAEETWQKLIGDESLFEIPGLPMALINNFQDRDHIADFFEITEEYDGHNLYQILITINKEKTEKIPFIILSEKDTEMQHLEENVLILNRLENLEDFEDIFVQSIANHPEAIGKFNRL